MQRTVYIHFEWELLKPKRTCLSLWGLFSQWTEWLWVEITEIINQAAEMISEVLDFAVWFFFFLNKWKQLTVWKHKLAICIFNQGLVYTACYTLMMQCALGTKCSEGPLIEAAVTECHCRVFVSQMRRVKEVSVNMANNKETSHTVRCLPKTKTY